MCRFIVKERRIFLVVIGVIFSAKAGCRPHVKENEITPIAVLLIGKPSCVIELQTMAVDSMEWFKVYTPPLEIYATIKMCQNCCHDFFIALVGLGRDFNSYNVCHTEKSNKLQFSSASFVSYSMENHTFLFYIASKH